MNKQMTVMIADRSEILCKRYAQIFRKNANFVVVGLAADIDEVKNLLPKLQPDVLVLDLGIEDANSDSSMEFFNSLKKEPLMILTYDKTIDRGMCALYLCGFGYSYQKASNDNALVKLVELRTLQYDYKNSRYDMERHTIHMLHEAGIPSNLFGYKFLKQAVHIAVKDMHATENMRENIYIPVSRLADTRQERVRQAIGCAIKIGCQRCQPEFLETFFEGVALTENGRPSEAEFVRIIADKVRRKLWLGKIPKLLVRRGKHPEVVINNTLMETGMPSNILGYGYFREALLFEIELRDIEVSSLTNDQYPDIAKMFNTTESNVERTMRHAIKMAWERGRPDYLRGLFGNSCLQGTGRPTNSEFVATLGEQIRLALGQFSFD